MKKSLLLLLAFVATIFAHSQLRVALVGGGHQSTVLEENTITGWDTAKGKYYSGRIGIHGGFVADMPFSATSKLSFQPGVIFHMKGRKFSKTYNPPSATNVISEKSTQYVNYIDVPLNLVLKFGRKTKFIIGGGPYGSFFFNGKETAQTVKTTGLSSSSENADLPVGRKAGEYEVLNYGVNALAGIEMGRVFLTANYSRSLNDFYHATYTGTFKHQVIGGTLGIFLGNPVKQVKKPADKDKDGIPDDKDACPDKAGPAVTQGCPDKDGDGIADKDDQCPDQPGTQSNNGCPVADQDKDGINDKDDKCPTVAGAARYDGCPVPDTDKDGVNDEEDRCPQIAGLAKYNGCPVPDTDGDGINDENDQCPTEKGTAQYKGCPPPPVEKEVIEKVNYAAKRIQFQSGKAVLLPASLKVLDEVAGVLKDNAALRVAIEGHTSADGALDLNMKLSESRAQAVKKYLVSKGVDETRLSAEGFGPTRPLNEGKTSVERMQNRRVEMKLSN